MVLLQIYLENKNETNRGKRKRKQIYLENKNKTNRGKRKRKMGGQKLFT